MEKTDNLIFTSILIAEDEEDHARLILKALREEGKIVNDINVVVNGQEALDYLNKKGQYKGAKHFLPGLILLDVKMPLKDGFEVLSEIKGNDKLKAIPVVMLTTTSTTEDITKALKIGANDYIVKPIKFKDFTNKVRNLGYYWGIVSDAKKAIK
jgi:two-component system, response regulator